MTKSELFSIEDVTLLREQFKNETGNSFISEELKHESIIHPDYADWLEEKLMGATFAIIEFNRKNITD